MNQHLTSNHVQVFLNKHTFIHTGLSFLLLLRIQNVQIKNTYIYFLIPVQAFVREDIHCKTLWELITRMMSLNAYGLHV